MLPRSSDQWVNGPKRVAYYISEERVSQVHNRYKQDTKKSAFFFENIFFTFQNFFHIQWKEMKTEKPITE